MFEKRNLIKTILFFCLVLLAGCEAAKPLETLSSSNGWTVELCFKHGEYSIYRFTNGQTEWRYFVVPEGEMIDIETRQDSEGNSSTHPVNNIKTFKKEK